MVTLCVILSASLTSRCHQSAQVSIPAPPAAGSIASGRSHCLDGSAFLFTLDNKASSRAPSPIPLLSGVCGQYKWYSPQQEPGSKSSDWLWTPDSPPASVFISDGIVTVGVFPQVGCREIKMWVWCPGDALWVEAG